MTDFMKKPEVEYDNSADGSITLSWLSEDKKSKHSLVIHDGSLVGVSSTAEPPRGTPLWSIKLPKGLIKIDCSVMR